MAVSLSSYGFQTASPASWRRRRAAAAAEKVEIRVCVNRSCGRQGSREILAVLSALAPTGVAVTSCGCLGRCGAGPNLAVLPAGSLVGHCGTAARAAQLLADLCGSAFDPQRSLEVLTLRKKGERELEKGNAAEAEALLSQALGLEPSGGLHFIYKSRSSARLAIGDNAGALDDANEASRIDPKYPQAYICQGDAFLAMGEWNAAEKAYSTALQLDPSIRRSKSFKAQVAKLQENLITLNTSS
ncbi:small glutamine-rich tetratricopeptide repeat-containing protein 2 [Phoenix dactylifera]|uniref:Small glutamine-rich tetratricopeptide repeat-containing protein 2 n=1 Tax=Phoenix dactylifera TaxID=42345 RepID=A0A8B7CT07_PHODC|nr:small glutamine-rich tetratricopeptide repeat-containing protein 2 [Phoenix dactylifera]